MLSPIRSPYFKPLLRWILRASILYYAFAEMKRNSVKSVGNGVALRLQFYFCLTKIYVFATAVEDIFYKWSVLVVTRVTSIMKFVFKDFGALSGKWKRMKNHKRRFGFSAREHRKSIFLISKSKYNNTMSHSNWRVWEILLFRYRRSVFWNVKVGWKKIHSSGEIGSS